jgi:hypothetical protein
VIRETRSEVRLLWRGYVLPIMLIITALLAIANVVNSAQSVRADYALLQHTKAQYAQNGMDFGADLARPAKVTSNGDDQTITNLARYDYDTFATAAVAIAPSSSVQETLKYFGFLVFPVLFFLVGLWLATGQRRYRLEKVTLVREGTARTIASRQLALIVAAVAIIVVTLLVDVISRGIAAAVLRADLPLGGFPPLTPAPEQNLATQCGLMLLVALFFGGGGIAVGAITGVFAVPAIVFLAWDFVVPIAAQHDPRNWFAVLGHAVFQYSGTFELAQAVPLAVPIAASAAIGGAAILIALGYVGIRLRNPRAS